jgi:sulfate transport system substrate-binding protein
MRFVLPLALAALLGAGQLAAAAEPDSILNASYDVGREVYQQINNAYLAKRKAAGGSPLKIEQSHNGTGAQARAIVEGLQADVVTFNQVIDIQTLQKAKLVGADWQSRLPNKASPFYSLPAFLVRAGNPKNIKDWGDLARDGVGIVMPNPKTSGNGRYTYLAARAWAIENFKGDEKQINAFLTKMFANGKVYDTGGRASTTTFAERGIGDVLITFESETRGTAAALPDAKYEVVVPSVSLLSEFPVAVVDTVARKRGSTAIVEDYLKFLYTPEAQEILARNFYRVNDKNVAEKHKADFPAVKLVTVEDVYGGWDKVFKDHFGNGGLLDTVFVGK